MKINHIHGGNTMITITNIRNINYTDYDEVWAIVRSFKESGKDETGSRVVTIMESV